MSSPSYRIEYEDGWAFLVISEPDYFKPEMVEVWYAISESTPTAVEAFRGCEIVRTQWPGQYQVNIGGKGFASVWMLINLKDGRKVVRTDYPCPKVRKDTEVKYREGRWLKRLKKGWVPV